MKSFKSLIVVCVFAFSSCVIAQFGRPEDETKCVEGNFDTCKNLLKKHEDEKDIHNFRTLFRDFCGANKKFICKTTMVRGSLEDGINMIKDELNTDVVYGLKDEGSFYVFSIVPPKVEEQKDQVKDNQDSPTTKTKSDKKKPVKKSNAKDSN